ncbi:MAG: tRNA dihydrouridine(20/20a) synthase DusA [Geminicoccaceae bacterium]
MRSGPATLTGPAEIDRRLSIAPMMDWTDRHCRYFHRLLAPRALLYTEMVHCGAILRGDADRHLAFDRREHPVALQLGGCEPDDLARAAAIGAARGYDEINLNCGCPSERVRRGSFGACLMREPELVATCVGAMIAAVGSKVPVTVKCRIGVDDSDDYPFLARFVATVADAGCTNFIVHARKAWLRGLSPKQNREIPPLRYELVHHLRREFPALRIVLNGGLRSVATAAAEIGQVDGVMIGREAYENPWSLNAFEAALLGPGPSPLTRHEVVAAMADYAAAQSRHGVPVRAIGRHMLGLFNGLPGARAWRHRLATAGTDADAGLLPTAASLVSVDEAEKGAVA